MNEFDFGAAAALLGMAAFYPYVRNTLRGVTRPARATWLVWSVVTVISTACQYAGGATLSLWFSLGQCAMTIGIFGLSLRLGWGRFLYRSDWVVLAACGAGLLLWAISDSAGYALAVSLAISAIGAVPTFLAAWRNPWQETCVSWVLGAVAAAMALSISTFDPVVIAYPLYLVLLYSGISLTIIAARARGWTQRTAV